jgi:two-component system, sensor histidine kinase and response regulator
VRQSLLFDCMVQVLVPPVNAKVVQKAKPFVRTGALPPARKERILLAEDNVVNQRVALGNLRKLGYEAEIAANGLEVLEAIAIKKYDIVFMDCHMPELDGYEATREIRRQEKAGQRIWIIAMTANVMVGDREKCLVAGMDDYVSKPLRRADLRAALERFEGRLSSPIDEDKLDDLADESGEDLAELIELFVATAPKSITDMHAALEKENAERLAFAAHTLKGSCGNLGKFPLYEICVQMELAARNGNMSGIGDLVASAENELRRLIEALKSYGKPKSSP